MDAKQATLDKKLVETLKRATELACQIQVAQQGSGTPHYDQIEMSAHAVGQQLSRPATQPNRSGTTGGGGGV